MENDIVSKNIRVMDPCNETVTSVSVNVSKQQLCRTCNESPRFSEWIYCWPCGISILDKEYIIKEYWHNIKDSFLGKQISDKSFNLADFGSTHKRETFWGRNFKHCDFIGTTFTNIDFSSCEFEDVDFTGATFTNCLLNGTSFKKCCFNYVKFDRVNLANSGFQDNKFLLSLFHKKNSFTGSTFERTSFFESKFDCKVKFDDAKLESVSLVDCSVPELDLSASTEIKNIEIFGKKTKINKIRLYMSQWNKINIQEDLLHVNVHFDIPFIRVGNNNEMSKLKFPLWSEYNQTKDYFNVTVNSIIYASFVGMIFHVFGITFGLPFLIVIFIWFIMIFSLGVAYLIYMRSQIKKKLNRAFEADLNQTGM